MSRIQDIAITNIHTITGIMATVFIRFLGLATATKIMAAIEAVILLIVGIMDMAAIEEGMETAGIKAMAVIAAGAIVAASIDKNADIIT
ncbi:MAG: hypothetical protein ACU88J_09155 [Gammaproteobacteria bacterium]